MTASLEAERLGQRRVIVILFEQTLVELWRQVLIENAKVVELGSEKYHVRRTPKLGLRQVDFIYDWDKDSRP